MRIYFVRTNLSETKLFESPKLQDVKDWAAQRYGDDFENYVEIGYEEHGLVCRMRKRIVSLVFD